MLKISRKLSHSIRWSFAGLRYTFKHELAFRLELLMAIILSPAAFYIAADLNQLLILLLSVYAVLIIELINTSIEATVDRISIEHHELSKYAKDVGSAAVFCSIMLMIMVWGLVLWSIY